MAWYSLRDILFTIKESISLLDKQGVKNDKAVEAVVAIQTAIIETRKFITTVGYEPNSDLSKLWLASFDKVKKARIYSGNDFPEYLYNKAKFWGDPKVWLQEPGSLELVPTLKELEKECDSILVKIR
jgi:hypothetical protein